MAKCELSKDSMDRGQNVVGYGAEMYGLWTHPLADADSHNFWIHGLTYDL